MEEKSGEIIPKRTVKNLSLKNINHNFVNKIAKGLLLIVLLGVILIGVIFVSIFVYFEYMDHICMHKCLDEWGYSQEICRSQYCH